MRIVCPNCEAAYEVPQAVLSLDRPVRCARCGQDWAPAASPPVAPPPTAPLPTAPPPTAPPPVAPLPSLPLPPMPPATKAAPPPAAPALNLGRVRSLPVVPLPPAPGQPPPAADAPVPRPAPHAAPRVRVPVLAGWILSALVLLGSAWAAYAWRGEIMRAWPPSARVYTALGVAGR